MRKEVLSLCSCAQITCVHGGRSCRSHSCSTGRPWWGCRTPAALLKWSQHQMIIVQSSSYNLRLGRFFSSQSFFWDLSPGPHSGVGRNTSINWKCPEWECIPFGAWIIIPSSWGGRGSRASGGWPTRGTGQRRSGSGSSPVHGPTQDSCNVIIVLIEVNKCVLVICMAMACKIPCL